MNNKAYLLIDKTKLTYISRNSSCFILHGLERSEISETLNVSRTITRQVSVATSRRKVLLVKDNFVELQLDCHLIFNVIYLSLGSVGLTGFSIKVRRRCC